MRILLFLATNLAILIVLGVVMQLLGLDRALAEQGVSVFPLFVMCAVLGVGGSFISLLISKWMALRSTGAQVIEQPRNDTEAWLLQTVSHQAQAAGIGMPTLAVFPSDSPNAFATGANKDKALVAVSSGLLARMRRNEVEAVLGHEIGHVANGDMVTLALIQGVLNTFVFFLARVIGQIVDQVVFRRGEGEQRGVGMGYFMVVMLAQVVLGLLASLIVFGFSRRREFRADREGARLAGRENMIGALERLKAASEAAQPLPESLRAFGISGGGRGWARLFMTHPPLDERIAALRAA
jgi:heat shock protein HtpX